MTDKITLDKETFKALAIDTRVNILKKIDERFQLTLTDLSKELELAPSTVKEHLDKLVAAGLIVQVDKGMKWKYYRLTRKGKSILNPYEKKVWIILAFSLVSLFALLYRFFSELGSVSKTSLQCAAKEPTGSAPASWEGESLGRAMDYAAESPNAVDVATSLAPSAKEALSSVPYAEFLMVIVLVLVAGICVGYLIKKRRIL